MSEGLTLAQLAAFNVALFFAVAAPGPAFLLCTQAALRGGRAEGAAVGAGLAVMAGLWTLAALAGLEALFDLFPALYFGMKLGGALLVLFFAVQIWRTARDPVAAAPPVSGGRAFLRGFALNLANPKSIIFSAGVLLVIFPPNLSVPEMALITANHILLEVVVYSALAAILTRPAIRARYLAFKPTLSRIMAVVLGGLGLRLLVSS
ncbi:LysE family translocator [Jannaschia aquimarina]|uniref:RhtC_4 protein n=1 Tax=Jannaschia aquimarina TaxID=935700 RepID=A0A0D1EFY2_9RHOB|nr:LysE family transporter [Jannaschia aquimarina]KIT15781.1 Threonine efflux protein [Jannaschia aquimarina]SNT20972.1 Threonine/homoserine/homoserine lactone efflux protein [Jannaschia aquimarina]